MQLWDSLHHEAQKKMHYNYPGFIKGQIKPLCSVGAIKRFVNSYFKAHPLEYAMVTKGEDKAKSYYQPAFGSQKDFVTFRNQMWQIDSSPLDAFVRGAEAFRPYILSIINVYSGRCVMHLERTSNALHGQGFANIRQTSSH